MRTWVAILQCSFFLKKTIWFEKKNLHFVDCYNAYYLVGFVRFEDTFKNIRNILAS